MMDKCNERDRAVLSALDDNIRRAPSIGVCAECFAALKLEFERVMAERDAARRNSVIVPNGFRVSKVEFKEIDGENVHSKRR